MMKTSLIQGRGLVIEALLVGVQTPAQAGAGRRVAGEFSRDLVECQVAGQVWLFVPQAAAAAQSSARLVVVFDLAVAVRCLVAAPAVVVLENFVPVET
jgi:hypothetical protein